MSSEKKTCCNMSRKSWLCLFLGILLGVLLVTWFDSPSSLHCDSVKKECSTKKTDS